MALGSSTAPDKIWAPTSEPFSTTQMLISFSFFAASCASLHAVDNPAGPAPTMTTSNSIDSLSKIKILVWLNCALRKCAVLSRQILNSVIEY